MHIGEKIRFLRQEKELSQNELGKMIDGDARQISLYETKKISPSSDAISKLAKVLNVSADYLLFDEAQRRPLILEVDDVLETSQKLKSLPEEDKKAINKIIDSIYLKSQIQQLAAK